jgi:hypothetical protein
VLPHDLDFAIESVRASIRSPWENGTAEIWVGGARRECFDQVIAMDEAHVRRPPLPIRLANSGLSVPGKPGQKQESAVVSPATSKKRGPPLEMLQRTNQKGRERPTPARMEFTPDPNSAD